MVDLLMQEEAVLQVVGMEMAVTVEMERMDQEVVVGSEEEVEARLAIQVVAEAEV